MTKTLPQDEPKFLADATVVRLAKWLRILGYDTVCSGDSEQDLLLRAGAEGRTVLSRKRKWPACAARHPELVILRRERAGDQIQELLERSVILPDERRFLTRCIRCNIPLEEVLKDRVAESVPIHIRENIESFHGCPGCGRVYWPGSHPERIRQFLRRRSPDRLP
ncbi:MAG: Mut7-C RNAse domain-containing protein [Syntrophales bacterium]|nr:Mut7-C RNAse domain-containing protein [Syntrophales bacterium]